MWRRRSAVDSVRRTVACEGNADDVAANRRLAFYAASIYDSAVATRLRRILAVVTAFGLASPLIGAAMHACPSQDPGIHSAVAFTSAARSGDPLVLAIVRDPAGMKRDCDQGTDRVPCDPSSSPVSMCATAATCVTASAVVPAHSAIVSAAKPAYAHQWAVVTLSSIARPPDTPPPRA